MAFPNDNSLFGAEFDPSTIIKGVEAVISSFSKLDAKTQELQTQFEGTTKELQSVEVELQQTKADIEGVGKSTTGAKANVAELTQKFKDLTATNGNLSVAYKKQQEELEKSRQANEKVKKTIEDVNTSQKKVIETFGKPIALNVDISKMNAMANTVNTNLNKLKASFGASFDNVSNLFHENEFLDLDERLIAARGEFQEIGVQVDFLAKKLLELEPGTQEFNDLAQAVRAGNVVIKEYETLYQKATEEVAKSDGTYKSIRTRLRELRDELTKLEEAGQEETQHYKDVQIQAAKLTDQYGDMQQQIRILASDTKYLDFGLAAINAAASGFQAASGALELFGLSTEDAQAAQTKLLAIMSIVQGLHQLRILLLKEDIIQTVGGKIATDAYSASQRILGSVLGQTAAASKAANAALITTGVGALIVAVGFLISKIIEWNQATDAAKAANERLNQSLADQQRYMQEDLAALDLNSKLRQERLKARTGDERKIFEEGQAAYIDKIKFYNAEIKKLQDDFNELTSKDTSNFSKDQLKDYAEQRTKILDAQVKIFEDAEKLKQDNFLSQAQEDTRRANDELARQKRARQAQSEARLADTRNLQTKELSQLKFDFDQQIRELRRGGQSTVEVENLYQTKRFEINDKYRKLRLENERQYNIEIEQLQLDAGAKRVANMGEEFERERALIEQEYLKSKSDLQTNQTAFLNKALKDRIEGVISPEVYKKSVDQINSLYNSLFDTLDDKTTNARIDLGAKKLQSTIEGINQVLGIKVNSLTNQAAELYLKGKISYAAYQKSITKIQDEENNQRLENLKAALKKEIASLEQRQLGNISADEREKNRIQLDELNNQLTDANAEQESANVASHKRIRDENLEHLQSILSSYQSFAQTVVGFLNSIAETESRNLNRSIALQEKRVANAKDLAEKGNAQYLELEQKRLDELEKKKAASAQKQIAINNALTASAALVAAISAVADASEKGGPIAAIAAGVAIVAALASLYQFVASLEPPTNAQFFEGTEYVEQGRHKQGRDTIPAKLTIGERVVTKDKNEQYWDALHAIHNGTVPANVLNEFVNLYPNISIPQLDYSRIGLATDRHFAGKEQIETNHKLSTLNETLEQVVNKLDNLDNVNMRFDEEGFAVSLIRAVSKRKLMWQA